MDYGATFKKLRLEKRDYFEGSMSARDIKCTTFTF